MRQRSRDRDFLTSKYIENALVPTSLDGNFCPRTVRSLACVQMLPKCLSCKERRYRG